MRGPARAGIDALIRMSQGSAPPRLWFGGALFPGSVKGYMLGGGAGGDPGRAHEHITRRFR